MSGFNDLVSKAGYFSFVLSQFGLSRVKVEEFKPGKPLKNDEDTSGGNFKIIDRGQSNMHTGPEGQPPMSPLGTPVFSDMQLRGSKSAAAIHLLWVLLEVNQTKNIVRTNVQGRDGSVKEYISDGDYIINIRGAFVDTFKDTYPKDVVTKMIRICQLKEPLYVTSEYLCMFNIDAVVVDSFKFAQEEGKQNIQRFELTCSSDVPLELKKKQGV